MTCYSIVYPYVTVYKNIYIYIYVGVYIHIYIYIYYIVLLLHYTILYYIILCYVMLYGRGQQQKRLNKRNNKT